ncbi:hypothetical protein PI124_g20302 [Phytophthora idaei]|nr:hypothetical protein PI126_g17642 [Phytophthora idaei]KAG3234648.1 hypothetical protein PI124_g20302 [Phytophthora idaei]
MSKLEYLDEQADMTMPVVKDRLLSDLAVDGQNAYIEYM